MADLHSNIAIFEFPSHDRSCVVSKASFPLDILEFLPSLDEIFTRFWALTSFISRRFVHFIEDLIHQDSCNCYHEGVEYPLSDSSVSKRPGTSREVGGKRNSLPVNINCGSIDTRYTYSGVSFVFKGLMLPLFGLRLAWTTSHVSHRLALNYIRSMQVYVRGLISRVKKTLRGSSDDIGWLQRTPGMAPVEDGTTRFFELLEDIRNDKHKLPDSYVYLLIPGLFSNHGPLYFVNTKKFFSKMGLTCHIAKIHSEASSEQNAWVLKQYIEELYWGSGKPVMLLGHSKGGNDAAAALSLYTDDLKNKVAGLAFVQSPYGGSPVASDILREGQLADKETRRIMEFLICKIIKGDIRALEDLTYEKRKDFLMNHELPKNIPLVSFHTEANIAPSVLATMTHIAHAELPWLPLPQSANETPLDYIIQKGRRVPVLLPVSALMAMSACHLKLRYGEKSDGVVTCRDAEVPGSLVVRLDRKLDHSWIVYSSSKKDPKEANATEMCEAILMMLVELGKKMEKKDN